jgi:hypothetical protein
MRKTLILLVFLATPLGRDTCPIAAVRMAKWEGEKPAEIPNAAALA